MIRELDRVVHSKAFSAFTAERHFYLGLTGLI